MKALIMIVSYKFQYYIYIIIHHYTSLYIYQIHSNTFREVLTLRFFQRPKTSFRRWNFPGPRVQVFGTHLSPRSPDRAASLLHRDRGWGMLKFTSWKIYFNYFNMLHQSKMSGAEGVEFELWPKPERHVFVPVQWVFCGHFRTSATPRLSLPQKVPN